jgi:2-polyprenyl-6-methoxyphenol hydroxylase-like FAD-dependent oxidoreductase
MYRVSRRKFRFLCAEGIQVEYGKILKDITYDDTQSTVTAIFTDGSQATGSLLVGADGAQSVVRTHIFGPEKAKASSVPYSALNLAVCYNDAEKAKFVRQLHPIMAMAIHPDGYWLWISSWSSTFHVISIVL